MQPAEQARICSSLKCDRCRRSPTAAEVQEMVSNFGGKLDESDVGATLKSGNASCLVWRCLQCCETKPTVAEKAKMRAARWAEWKASSLAGGMSQQEIDDLERELLADRDRTHAAIKRGRCPTCGAPLRQKPDHMGRPYTNLYCSAPRPEGTVAHFLVGVDDDELAAMRAS